MSEGQTLFFMMVIMVGGTLVLNFAVHLLTGG